MMSAFRNEELARYLKAIRAYPPLSREEEHALAVRACQGEVAAKQKLVRHNLAFVLAFARKHRRGTARLDDLVQEGNLGLVRAVEKFDPHAGYRFLTYAAWWVRAHVGKYLRETASAVRPHSSKVAPADVSLHGVVDEEGSPLLERLADEAPDVEAVYRSLERDRAVRETVSKLRVRLDGLGWDIVESRLARDSPATLAEVGRTWGLSRERVRQVEARTRALLRRHLAPVEQESVRDAA
jgi:RNA polymerase primary sigma factor